MEEDKDLYDFSDYPKDHFLYSEVNKKKIGKFKDELNGVPMEAFCGLRAKLYSILYDWEQLMRAKGIKKSVKEKHLRHEHYVDSLINLTVFSVGQNIIKSRGHQVSSYHVKKIALTAFDVKRWICCDGVNTLAHGHYRMNDIKCEGKCSHIV